MINTLISMIPEGAEIITDLLQDVIASRAVPSIIAIITLLWSATGFLRGLLSAIDLIHSKEYTYNSFVMRGIGVLIILLAVPALFLLLLLAGLSSVLIDFIPITLPGYLTSMLNVLASDFAVFIMATLAFFLMMRYIPSRRPPTRTALISSALTSLAAPERTEARITSLDPFIRPDAVDAEVPEEHHANGEGLGQIIAETIADKMAEHIAVHHHQNYRVDDQTNDVDRGELRQLAADGPVSGFGESPQPIPGEVADHRCGKRDGVGGDELNLLWVQADLPADAQSHALEDDLHHVEHSEIHHRANCADDGEFDEPFEFFGIDGCASGDTGDHWVKTPGKDALRQPLIIA
jgi:hypothetical protein